MQASGLRRKKGSIYTPPQQNMTVWDLPGRIIRPSPGYSGFPGPKKWLRTSRHDSQYRGGYLGQIIRPRRTRKSAPITGSHASKFLAVFQKLGRIIRPHGRIIRPLKTGRNSKTETIITFSFGLRFWWSWDRFEDSNELYKIVQGTIIVQKGRTDQND